MDRIILKHIKELELRVRLSNHFNIPFEDIDSQIIDFTIGFIKEAGEKAEVVNTYQSGSNWSPNLEIFEYNIDVSTGVWMSIALVMDIYYTKGIASTALSTLGKSNQIIFKIERANGELCLLKRLKKADVAVFDVKVIEEIFAELECPVNYDSCFGTVSETCVFKGCSVPDLLLRLEKKKAVSKIDADRWKMNI